MSPSAHLDPATEIEQLRARLEAAEETLRAIRAHEVDALVVGGPDGERVYSLGGADEGYMTFLEVMGEGALTLAGDGTIIYCNRRFGEMVASPAERISGMSIYDFVAPEDQGRLRAMMWEAFTTAGVKGQLAIRKLDGSAISAGLTATRMKVGETTSVCLLVNDLTEHDARLAAESAGAAKDRFLALLSHELRTPLTPIVMTIDSLMLNADLPPAIHDDLAMIRRNVELETRLIDDLLDLSRVATGKLHLQPRKVGMHALIQNVLEMLEPDVRLSQVRIQCNLSALTDLVNADPARLQQVLWNLLKNAIKFSNEQGIITIRTYTRDVNIVCVEVRDTGVGIASDMLPRVFDAFEQGTIATTHRSGGLGLGLAIAKALIEAHAGTIQVQSDGIGQGACFTMELPLSLEERLSEITNDSKVPIRDGQSSLRVLLVEDHADTAVTMRKLLEQMGHKVTTANSVASALICQSDGAFDLVISDIGLPDGTGYELMREIRKNREIPAIALSGYGMASDLESSSAAGFTEHITKPIEVAQLETVIARITKGN